MKRTATRIACAFLTFILGTTASSLWRYYQIPQSSPPSVSPGTPATSTPAATPMVSTTPIVPSQRDFYFGGDLKLVSNEVQLRNDVLRYKVTVIYPQIDGANTHFIRKFNKRIEQLAIKDYQWVLNPSREDLRYYKEGPHKDAFNTVYLDYKAVTTDSVLSIYFEGYGYGIGAAHAVQYSFSVNYDLDSHRYLKLSDIFKPRSKYLKFISEYCIEQLSRREHGEHLVKDYLAPVARNFESWNMTYHGIRFNFDECRVFACAAGEQTVEIPFTALREMMSIR